MGLDIRTPLGLLFTLIGLLLFAYGALTKGAAMYSVSLGVNLNLLSGVAMTIFGAGLLIATYRARTRRAE
jgi:hypothetical protein